LVTDNIRVANNSWGSGRKVTNYRSSDVVASYRSTIAAARAAQNNGTLFVFSSGNSQQDEVDIWGGLPHHAPGLIDSWLTVIALDNTKTEAYYTNRCGRAKAFCVSAPGSAVRAARANSGDKQIRHSGTSMSAPHVSGIAALLMQKFPSLSTKAIAARIKKTSSLEGLAGKNGETLATHGQDRMRNIFCHGLVNQQDASAQISSLNLATRQDDFRNGSVDLSQQNLRIPKGLPLAVKQQVLAVQFVTFDSFDGANFTVQGNRVFQTVNRALPTPLLGCAGGLHNSADQERTTQNIISLNFGRDFEVHLNFSEVALTQTIVSKTFWGPKPG
jgi:subtilase-type serine protease